MSNVWQKLRLHLEHLLVKSLSQVPVVAGKSMNQEMVLTRREQWEKMVQWNIFFSHHVFSCISIMDFKKRYKICWRGGTSEKKIVEWNIFFIKVVCQIDIYPVWRETGLLIFFSLDNILASKKLHGFYHAPQENLQLIFHLTRNFRYLPGKKLRVVCASRNWP